MIIDKEKTKKLNLLGKLKLVSEILDSCEETWERENVLGFLKGWIWKEEVKENVKNERTTRNGAR